MKISGNKVLFSTGREKSANCGIIGLAPDGNVTDGYDSEFYSKDDAEWMDPEDILTAAERVELAEYMIEQWQRFKATAETEI